MLLVLPSEHPLAERAERAELGLAELADADADAGTDAGAAATPQLAALCLIWMAVTKAWAVIAAGLEPQATLHVVEALGILASGVVALQISQTVVEEEVVRDAHISGPTRVRRFLSRFMVVLVVALAIEGLVATFKAQEQDRKSVV